MKLNTFLHPNEHTEQICWYFVRQLDAVTSKIRHFQISKSIFKGKYNAIFLKRKFILEYQFRGTTLIKSLFLNHFCKTSFSKNVPYFLPALHQTVLQDINKSFQDFHLGVKMQ